jgi:hypothetical protein
MRTNVPALILLVSVAIIGGCAAGKPEQHQQRQTPQIRVGLPVPLWPKDGLIPKEPTHQYVFYDLPADEYVVVYPENIEEPDYDKNPGPLHIERIGTTRETKPEVSFSVNPEGDKFKYRYRMSNKEGARKAITTWMLSMPELPDGPLAAPPAWLTSAGTSRIAEVGEALGAPHIQGAMIIWFFADETGPIGAGKSLENFSVVSSLKPGMSIGYVRGGLIKGPSTHLPEVVASQLEPVLSLDFNSEKVLLLGPRFARSTPRDVIARDLELGIKRMIDSGQLQSDSPMVREALDRLGVYSARPDASQNAQLSLGQEPKSQFEKDLQQALVLALN